MPSLARRTRLNHLARPRYQKLMDGEHRVLGLRVVISSSTVQPLSASKSVPLFFTASSTLPPESLQQFGLHVPHGFEQPVSELIETRAYLVKTPVYFRPSRLRSFRRTFQFLHLRPSRLCRRAGTCRALRGAHVSRARTAPGPSQLSHVQYYSDFFPHVAYRV